MPQRNKRRQQSEKLIEVVVPSPSYISIPSINSMLLDLPKFGVVCRTITASNDIFHKHTDILESASILAAT